MNAVMVIYDGAPTVVRTAEGDSMAFDVKVRLYCGSVLSPLLSVIVMEVVRFALRVVVCRWQRMRRVYVTCLATHVANCNDTKQTVLSPHPVLAAN